MGLATRDCMFILIYEKGKGSLLGRLWSRRDNKGLSPINCLQMTKIIHAC